MQSSDLDYEWTRLLGEIQTTTEQLESLRTARLGGKPLTADQRDEYVRQTAEEERLKKLLASLQEQRKLLDGEREALQIRSPIAGRVLTWDLTDALQQRPVKRGQVLMTVADTGGPWVLEVEVPDQDAGYVLAARRASRPDLPVSFILATNPSQTYAGRLEKLAEISEADQRQQLSVTALVRVEKSAIPHRLGRRRRRREDRLRPTRSRLCLAARLDRSRAHRGCGSKRVFAREHRSTLTSSVVAKRAVFRGIRLWS